MGYKLTLDDIEGNDGGASPVVRKGGYELSFKSVPGKKKGYSLTLDDIEREEKRKKLEYYSGADRTPVDTLRDALAGIVGGLGKGGQTIAGMFDPETAKQADVSGLAEAIASPKKSVGGEMVRGAGSYAPYAIAGGPSIIGQLAAGAAHGAATSEPGEEHLIGKLLPKMDIFKGKTGGAMQGAILNALPIVAGKVFEALRPSKLYRGNLSDEELAKNLEAVGAPQEEVYSRYQQNLADTAGQENRYSFAGERQAEAGRKAAKEAAKEYGTETPLHEVTQSPGMKYGYENVVAPIPGSAAYSTMQRAAKQVQQEGEQLMKEVGPDIPSHTMNRNLHEALSEAAEDVRHAKQGHWKKVNQIADNVNLKVKPGENIDLFDNNGLVIGRTNFQDKAKEILNEIKASKELEAEYPPGFVADLERYANNTEGNNLKRSNIFKGLLRDKANDFYTEGKMHLYGQMKDLQRALQKDIDSAIENSGSQELKDAYQEANQYHAIHYAPFEDPDIVKFIRKGGDPDVLFSHFLKGGKNDRGEFLNKLMSKLPSAGKKNELPLKMLLGRNVDRKLGLDPGKFATEWGALGPNQRAALVPDVKLRAKIDKYARKVEMNREALNVMFNPKTGARLAHPVVLSGLTYLLGGPAKAGVAMAGMAGARGATKALTSPTMREALINEMLKNKPKFDTIGNRTASTSLAQAVANAMKNRKK